MVASTSVFGKIFNRQNDGRRDTSTFYNFLLMISVFLGWGILYVTDLSFDAGVLFYSADRKSTRLNSSHESISRMPSSA